MVAQDVGTECGAVHVGVDLRRRDAFVSHHQLDSVQVGTTLEEMRSKAVSQRVRTDLLMYTRQLSKRADQTEDRDARDRLTTT